MLVAEKQLSSPGGSSSGDGHEKSLRKKCVKGPGGRKVSARNPVPGFQSVEGRGRRASRSGGGGFTTMTISQKFVFGLGFLAAVKGVGGVNPRSSVGSHSGVSVQPGCQNPTFLERVGSVDSMPWLLKPSDETVITLGLIDPKEIKVPLRYVHLTGMEEAVKSLEKVITTVSSHMRTNFEQGGVGFGKTTYDVRRHEWHTACATRIFHRSPCFVGMCKEADQYSILLGELLSYGRDTGYYEDFKGNIDQAVYFYKDVIRGLAVTLNKEYKFLAGLLSQARKNVPKSTIDKLRNAPDRVFENRESGFGRALPDGGTDGGTSTDFSGNAITLFDFLSAQLDDFKRIYNETEFPELQKQCETREVLCVKQSRIERAKALRREVVRKRAEREVYRNSASIKILDIIATSYVELIFGFIAIPGMLRILPAKVISYRGRRKCINTAKIIRDIAKAKGIKLKTLEDNMKACEQIVATKSEISRGHYQSSFPQGWSEPVMKDYFSPHRPVRSKKKPTDLRSFYERITEPKINSSKAKIPDYPWQTTGIIWGHQCLRPIYRKGVDVKINMDDKNIVAYAFFDKKEVEKKIPDKFSLTDMKEIEEIYETGHYASHRQNATGYKCFSYENNRIWEFKISSGNRLCGLTVEATREGKLARIPSLAVFDWIPRKKL